MRRSKQERSFALSPEPTSVPADYERGEMAWRKQILLKRSKKILGLSNVKASFVAAEIRRLRSDIPKDLLGKYEVMEWFNRVTPQPVQNSKSREKRNSYRVSHEESDNFLKSFEWRQLRMQVIKSRGARCECCGAHPSDGKTVINVDHIKPRKTHPQLAMDIVNLQVLCSICNHGKGNWDSTDWRKDSSKVEPIDYMARLRPMWSKE